MRNWRIVDGSDGDGDNRHITQRGEVTDFVFECVNSEEVGVRGVRDRPIAVRYDGPIGRSSQRSSDRHGCGIEVAVLIGVRPVPVVHGDVKGDRQVLVGGGVVIGGHRRISDRIDSDRQGRLGAIAIGVAHLVGDDDVAGKVGWRRIGIRPVVVEGEAGRGEPHHRHGRHAIAKPGVVHEDVTCDWPAVFVDQVGVVDSHGKIIDGVDRDRDRRLIGRCPVVVANRVSEAVDPVELRIRCVAKRPVSCQNERPVGDIGYDRRRRVVNGSVGVRVNTRAGVIGHDIARNCSILINRIGVVRCHGGEIRHDRNDDGCGVAEDWHPKVTDPVLVGVRSKEADIRRISDRSVRVDRY